METRSPQLQKEKQLLPSVAETITEQAQKRPARQLPGRSTQEQTRPSAAEDAVRTVQTRGSSLSLPLFPWSSQRPSLLLEPPPLLLQPPIPRQTHSLAPFLAPEKDQQSLRLLQGITAPRASGHGRPEGQKESGQNIRSGRCVLMGLPHSRWP